MDRSEYDSRIRALDERLEASLELVRSAHRVERRALDFLWMTSPSNPGAEGEIFAPLPSALPPSVLEQASARPARSGRQPQSRGPARWRSNDLAHQVVALLPEIPAVFDRDDFLRRFAGNPPERSMLYRVLQQLAWDGVIVVARPGSGRYPVRYRLASAEETAEAVG